MSREGDIRKDDVREDLRSGMPRQELLKKYKLTPRGLEALTRNLMNLPGVAAGSRIRPRKHLEFLLPISDSENPENTGLVYDISDDGVGTRGLKAQVHDVRTFVIPADDYFRLEPVMFQGICRWVEQKENRWDSAAGFKVVKLLRGSLIELQDIIRSLSLKPDRV